MSPAIPSIELLEKTHSFPGHYVFKVIGSADDGFLARAIGIVHTVVPSPDDVSHTQRATTSGKHMAISLSVKVPTAQAVQSIYEKLLALDGLVLLL